MITIRLNDDVIQIEHNCSLQELLSNKGYTHSSYAVFVNGDFVPKTQHSTTILQENDRVEIIVPTHGG